MEEAENEQRRIDRFWGIDFEVSNRMKEILMMIEEERQSITIEMVYKNQENQLRWEDEIRQEEEYECYDKSLREVI